MIVPTVVVFFYFGQTPDASIIGGGQVDRFFLSIVKCTVYSTVQYSTVQYSTVQ